MEWIIFLALLPLAYFVELCLHEGSHLLAAMWHQKLVPLGFYPYPHFHNGKFYFARYSVVPPTTPDPPHTLRHITPVIVGGLQVIVTGLLQTFIGGWWAAAFLLPFFLMGLGEILWWLRGYYWGTPTCDGKRWRDGDK